MTIDDVGPRVTIDTNLFVSGLLVLRSKPQALLIAWQRGAFRLIMSKELRDELVDVLRRPRFARRIATSAIADVLEGIDTTADYVTPLATLPLTLRDARDEMVLAAALGGAADFLVSGDADLQAVRDDPRLGELRIVTVAEFLLHLPGDFSQDDAS
jgi:putative PIN family toxin of toxin-antitoxin system